MAIVKLGNVNMSARAYDAATAVGVDAEAVEADCRLLSAHGEAALHDQCQAGVEDDATAEAWTDYVQAIRNHVLSAAFALEERRSARWAQAANAGDYLARYSADDLDDVSDSGSRCGLDDAELAAIEKKLNARGLTLVADDRGLVARETST
jgi:hypothetical protein